MPFSKYKKILSDTSKETKHILQAVSKRGDQIIIALEKYKIEKGAYPKNLEILKPSYLNFVPGTNICVAPEFKYFSQGDAFSLRVSYGPGFEEMIYESFGVSKYAYESFNGWGLFYD